MVLDRKPGIAGVHAAIGDLYVKSGNYVGAEQAYGAELKLAPNSPVILFRYGASLVKLGRSGEALGYLQRARQLNPSNEEIYFDLGKALFDEGKLDEAEVVFRKAVATQAPDAALTMAHYHLGQIYRRSGQAEKAREHLEIFSKLKSQAGDAAP